MSMFHLQKSFEKSLRSSPTTYQVPIITPLKTEIHKGCTGKAHACGSIKSTQTILNGNAKPATPKPKPKNDANNKNLRKNSLSSETISDSGSEVSSLNSNSNENSSDVQIPQKSDKPPVLPKPLKRKGSLNASSPQAQTVTVRRRTSDSVVDTTDNARNGVFARRGRLPSDAAENKDNPQEEASKLKRSSSFRARASLPNVLSRSRSQSGTPLAQQVVQQQPIKPSTPITRNGSFNNRIRTSFRAKNHTIQWNALWEKSFSHKPDGGSFKVLDKMLQDSNKVSLGYFVSYSNENFISWDSQVGSKMAFWHADFLKLD